MLIVPPYQRLSFAVSHLLTGLSLPSLPCAPAHLRSPQPVTNWPFAGSRWHYGGASSPVREASHRVIQIAPWARRAQVAPELARGKDWPRRGRRARF